MPKLCRIVTHHKDPELAARLWEKLGLAAVGWSSVGDTIRMSDDDIESTLMRERDKTRDEARSARIHLRRFESLEKGDTILAYQKRNIVSLVGTVIERPSLNIGNEIGNPRGTIRYPHQVSVKWDTHPKYFHRTNLGRPLSDWVALQGTIICRGSIEDLDLDGISDGAGPRS